MDSFSLWFLTFGLWNLQDDTFCLHVWTVEEWKEKIIWHSSVEGLTKVILPRRRRRRKKEENCCIYQIFLHKPNQICSDTWKELCLPVVIVWILIFCCWPLFILMSLFGDNRIFQMSMMHDFRTTNANLRYKLEMSYLKWQLRQVKLKWKKI